MAVSGDGGNEHPVTVFTVCSLYVHCVFTVYVHLCSQVLQRHHHPDVRGEE